MAEIEMTEKEKVQMDIWTRGIENPPDGTTLFDTLPRWAMEILERNDGDQPLKCGFCGIRKLKEELKICTKCLSLKSDSPILYCVCGYAGAG